jgi:hypothetical protein
MQITQGRSYILLDRAEMASLIREAQQILDRPDDGPMRADTATTIDHQATR